MNFKMNKPIIVDGVDVAECENIAIQDGYIGCTDNLVGECEGDNCIYKQLQRLKEENEELKNAKEEYYLNNLNYEIKLSELTQALEEVREIAYTTDFDIADIQKIVNEVLNENH